ncbi:MAG: aspartate aminotransferase family protein [Bacteroidetes bacterium]|nr:aspartate aminotransferase family protein [Bacteroidota bacterium]MBS1628591.1 aspartate aminotransferase family protein [Bacteroidota bacterium]
MKLFDVYPLQEVQIAQAAGSFVWDEHGQRYLDLYGGHAVISIGHTHPHYVARLNRQLGKIGFYSNSVKLSIQQELAELLGEVSGKKEFQLFLCNSGAEANENAMKLASFHTGRKKIIAFTGAFHGRTSLAVSATDNSSIIAPVNESNQVHFLPFNDVEALESWFAEEGSNTAAVLVEGIQGVGGIRVATDAFLQAIRRLCLASGAVFIADSVQCGYGRTGQFFSHDYSGVQADIYSVAKGMGNGFPVAGILIAPHIRPWHGMLGTTFGGNPLACAAALAVLEVIQEEQLMQQAAQTGSWLQAQLRSFPALEQVRGRGLMIGFDVPEHASLRNNLLYKHKIFTGAAKPQVIRLLPALNLKPEDAMLFLDAIRQELQLQKQAEQAY